MQKHQWWGWMFSGFLINMKPACISEHGRLLSEGARRCWLSCRPMALDFLKRHKGCSPSGIHSVLSLTRCCIAEASHLGNFIHVFLCFKCLTQLPQDVIFGLFIELCCVLVSDWRIHVSSATFCHTLFFKPPQGCSEKGSGNRNG